MIKAEFQLTKQQFEKKYLHYKKCWKLFRYNVNNMNNIITLIRVKIEDIITTVQFTPVALTMTSFQMTTE